MSPPTTPRSTRQSTPENNANGDGQSHAGDSPAFMTPRRKIGSLLAGFDSDSDSPNERQNTVNAAEPRAASRPSYPVNNDGKMSDPPNDSDDDDYDLPMAPRGRLAARMQAGVDQAAPRSPEQAEQPAPTTAQSRTSPSPPDPNGLGSDSEDDVRAASGRRRKQPEDITTPSEASRRSASPLFVPMGSPNSANQRNDSNSRDNAEINSPKPDLPPRDRVRALAARKREEREAKEREEAEKKAERVQRSSELGAEFGSEEEEEGVNENDAGRKLTQESRPARKASKKALLEMNRETQRMSRNMQLTHQAATKKKITLDSFLARFNQPKSGDAGEMAHSATASSLPPSDAEAREHRSTPPTSPPQTTNADDERPHPKTGLQPDATSEEPNHTKDDAPGSEPCVNSMIAEEGNCTEQPVSNDPKSSRRVHVNLPRHAVAQTQQHDSDSDLEVVTSPSKARRLAVFENVSKGNSHQSRSWQKLRTLANIGAPSDGHSSMNQAELEANLLRKAREQAAEEREEKIRRLREKGVNIQTAEERARTENEVEDLMEKARGEADALAKREKAAAKEGEDGQDELLDDESDEDYDGGDEDFEEGGEEDSEDDDDDDEGEENEFHEEANEKGGVTQEPGLIDDHAEEGGSESDGPEGEADNSEPEQTTNESLPHRKGRSKFVVHDDEDDENEPDSAAVASTPKQQPPNLWKQSGEFMGLSQAFAATLADNLDDTEQDSLSKLRQMPGMDLAMSEILEPDSQGVIRDSQNQETGSLDLLADYTQAGVRVADSPSAPTFTQYSQDPEATQDAGFVMSPFDQTKRFLDPPHSTVDTAPVNTEDTPIANRGAGRLRRGQQVAQRPDGEKEGSENPTAFDIMRKASKKPQEAYDKKKSKAKDVVDEAAEESEDEYAGLGGASDEESGSEAEYDRDMINDESGEAVDEKQLAAFNANLDRERDERDVNQLMKDITTGALRRKRGGGDDFDLSESDDERIEARRRAKRRQFAKMRKALLADDKLSKMADDPKKAAFLRTIEDRDYADENDFLADEYDNDNTMDANNSQENNRSEHSQQDGGDANADANGDTAGNKKRPLEQTSADAWNRIKSRRKVAMKKPTSLAEIRQSVSFLLDGPEAAQNNQRSSSPPPQEDGGNEEGEDEDELSRPGTTIRQRSNGPQSDGSSSRDTGDTSAVPNAKLAATFDNPRRRRGAVVDRLSLRRAASSNAKSAATGGPKFAFYANSDPGGSGSSSFKGPPPLLSRRSTTASTSSSSLGVSDSGSGSGTSGGASGGMGKAEVSSGAATAGSKKAAAVNYYAAARDNARQMELKKKEEQRRERRLGLDALKGNGERLKGLLGGEGSGQWD